jgi:hypothetical protein
MDKCHRHPEREARYRCMKYQIPMCAECMRCSDPEIYCKFRTACPIDYLLKERRRRERRAACPGPAP